MIAFVECLLFALGLSFILKYALDFLSFTFAISTPSKLLAGNDSWALVTGSNDGIGLGFAEELAKKGYNIIQVCRSYEKMKTASLYLEGSFGIKTKNVVFDFKSCAKNPNNSFSAIIEVFKSLNVEIVVNNVGIVKGFKDSIEDVLEMLSINVWTPVLISKLYANHCFKKGKISIINLGTIGAVHGLMLSHLWTYASTKAFIYSFTELLSSEGFDAMLLAPGWVDTPLTRPAGDIRVLLITKNQCAAAAIQQFGKIGVTYGHFKHWIAPWEHRLKNIRTAWLRLN